jgi:endonuclease/exonuclease/phosphatase family metal-dependent hydrolase
MSGDGALQDGDQSDFGTLAGGRLRVVTWNLWWQFGPWEERQPAISATIERLAPDVVCLQEVWAEQVDGFAKDLGYHSVFSSRIDRDGETFGNAVLTSGTITGHDILPLPAPPDMEELRTCVRADVDTAHGPVQVFSTHLNWRFDHSAVRQDQVDAICQFVAASPPRDFPPILCGDFNAEPDSDEVRKLTGKAAVPVPKLVFRDAWAATHGNAHSSGPDDGVTWSNTNPFAALALEYPRRIDYVFVGWPKTGGRGQVVDCEVVGNEPVGGVWPSDHFGVLATLRA